MKTILVVDDEPDNVDAVRAILEKNDFRVETAESGDECLDKLKKLSPDLILMDIMMPGTPVGKIVPQIKNIKIVFFTVMRMTDAEKEGLKKQDNVVEFIQKPFNIYDLLRTVQRIVG